MEDRKLYWIWLAETLGAGCKNSTEIIDACKCDAYNIYSDEGFSAFLETKIATPRQITKLKNKDLAKAREILEYCLKNGISILTPDSVDFPSQLFKIPSCPFILYLKGKLPSFHDKVSLSCVGTRKMTEVGKRCAYEFAYDLAKSGMIITSGMALGIDSIAHRGALDAGGSTIAVLGSGIDIIYPPQNEDLYEEIIKSGAVISEFSPGTPPLGHNFPVRNRIVSGLSAGTLVIEAGERSGSLNTAHHSFDQGRDVFAIPGPNGEYNNRGSNSLLKEGAVLVTDAIDIVNFYTERYGNQIKFNHVYKRKSLKDISLPETKSVQKTRKLKAPKQTTSEKSEQAPNRPAPSSELDKESLESLGEPMRSVALALYEKEMFPEEIADEIGISFGNVLTAISFLELQGIVKIISGGKFTIIK